MGRRRVLFDVGAILALLLLLLKYIVDDDGVLIDWPMDGSALLSGPPDIPDSQLSALLTYVNVLGVPS